MLFRNNLLDWAREEGRSRPQGRRTVWHPEYPGGGGGGGEGLVRAYFGKAKFGEGKIWYKILNTMERCGKFSK